MAAYEILLLNTAIPQIQAAQSGDTYVVPRDIAFSAALTLDAGTANGVPYLNGSKVLTTGSALTFDGSNLGLGVTLSAWVSGYSAMQIGPGATVNSTSDGRASITSNIFVGSGPQAKYIANGFGSAYTQLNGAHLWLTAPNNTSGANANASGISTIMTLDASGNLGLGVTPSAWSTGYYLAQQIGGGGSFIAAARDTSNELTLGTNAYFDGTNWKRTVANYATLYKASSGAHAWFNAASSTAGSNITFTQAMTLDASGNLVVGGTSAVYTNANRGNISINGTAQAILALSTGGSGRAYLYTDGSRLDLYNTQNDALTFGTNSLERARITSGGNFLIGTQTSGVGNADGVGIGYNSGASYQSIGHANGTSSGSIYISFGYNAGAIGNITQNGTTGVLYNITSDYRLKDVVGAVTGAGARIDALKPVDYTWKADGSAARGFLAHEFQEIYPNSVIGTKDAVDEEGKPIHQQMQASTSEVIADLVAELQSLRARVAQLEGK